MPLDPVAWLVMYNKHQAALADLIAANMRHRLPLEAVRDVQPPQQQVGIYNKFQAKVLPLPMELLIQ